MTLHLKNLKNKTEFKKLIETDKEGKEAETRSKICMELTTKLKTLLNIETLTQS